MKLRLQKMAFSSFWLTVKTLMGWNR